MLPTFRLLSTQILPWFNSTNSLQIESPRPVPFSFLVPMVVKELLLNSLSMFSFEIPTPVSATLIIQLPLLIWFETVMVSPFLQNFVAFANRF